MIRSPGRLPSADSPARRTRRDHAEQITAQLACAGASVAYLCVGVIILLRQPLSELRLILGIAGVCVVSLALALLARSLAPEGRSG